MIDRRLSPRPRRRPHHQETSPCQPPHSRCQPQRMHGRETWTLPIRGPSTARLLASRLSLSNPPDRQTLKRLLEATFGKWQTATRPLVVYAPLLKSRTFSALIDE